MSESSSPNATLDQHDEAWEKIHDLLAAGHWSRARAIFDQATSAGRDKIIEECAKAINKRMQKLCSDPEVCYQEPDTGATVIDSRYSDHVEALDEAEAIVLALKNAAPQEPSGKSPGTVGNDGYEQKASRGAPVRDVPAVAAPIAPSAIRFKLPLRRDLIERQSKYLQDYFDGNGMPQDMDWTDIKTVLDWALTLEAPHGK